MLGIEVVEVHVPAPLGKRERDGLSAEGAYNAIALDIRYVGTPSQETTGEIAHWCARSKQLQDFPDTDVRYQEIKMCG